MEIYLNLNGNSGISRYSINSTSIRIQFKTNAKVYVYSNSRPGQSHVNNMKQLAISGSGLQTYINKYIRTNFDSIE